MGCLICVDVLLLGVSSHHKESEDKRHVCFDDVLAACPKKVNGSSKCGTHTAKHFKKITGHARKGVSVPQTAATPIKGRVETSSSKVRPTNKVSRSRGNDQPRVDHVSPEQDKSSLTPSQGDTQQAPNPTQEPMRLGAEETQRTLKQTDIPTQTPEDKNPGSPTPEPDPAKPIDVLNAPASKEKYRGCEELHENGYTVNFQDISVIELLQFVSKISGTNFVFDIHDLQFNVTIVSHDPTSIDDLSAILLQVLKMHDLKVVEQGNNVLIYRNPNISKLSTVVTDGSSQENCDAVVVTRVFKLYSVSPNAAVGIIQPLLSHDAIVSASESTHHIIVSDIASNIDKVEELLRALDSPGTAAEIAEYEVKYANPSSLVSYCQDMLNILLEGEQMQIYLRPGTNKIFVISSPQSVAKALQLLKSLDSPDMKHTDEDVVSSDGGFNPGIVAPKSSRFFMYKLKYQNGDVIAKSLQEIGDNLYSTNAIDRDFINTINSVQWVEVNNSIVIVGNQANVDKVVSLLNGLDLPPKQVYIEVLILETSLENSWDFGVQWVAMGNEQNKLAYASGLLNNAPPSPGIVGSARATVPPAIPNPGNVPLPTPGQLAGFSDLVNTSSAFGLGIIGNVLSHKGKSFLTLGGLLSALDQDGDTIIVLNPRIMSQDTQKASFFVGQTIPFQTTSTVIQETGSVTQNIEYEDIGVNLVVTSTITPNNVVTLQIEQTISEIHSAEGTLTPVTDKTYAATRLQVPDGCFLVVGGGR